MGVITGGNNRHLRVATLHRPCVSPTGENKVQGSNTVYCQHIRELIQIEDTRQPRRALMEDLHDEVIKWKDVGDSVIIMGDFNEDMRKNYCQQWRDN